MLDKIQALQIPQKFQENVELLIVKSRARSTGPSQDTELSVLCWRCRRHASPLTARCPSCKHCVVHSPHTHEILPLVQFVPSEDINQSEAMELISRMPLPDTDWNSSGGAEVLRIDHDADSADPFLDKVDEDDESGVVVCNRSALLQLNPASVVVVQNPPLPPLYYRNMLPELAAVACRYCHHLFYLEDYEIQVLSKGQCPFCRHPVEDGTTDDDDRSLAHDSSASTPGSPTAGDGPWR